MRLDRGRRGDGIVNASERERSSWDLAEGDEIVPGRYALSLLGGGYNYEAWLAWDDDLFAVVVAKMLRPHLVEDAGALKGLSTEADTLARLSHPVIVRGFGSVLEGERPHVVLEHLEGPHLSRLIRKQGILALEQWVPLAIQLCSAAHYMSVRDIVHLDIKPRNVIIGAPPRLIDLSVARTLERAARITGHVGTDAYMAPEQCAPKELGPIGPPADVWGLGATLFFALTGERPFPRSEGYDEDDLTQRFPQLQTDHVPWRKGTPMQAAEIVDACLSKDPTERPTAAEVGQSLEPVMETMPKRRIITKLRPRLR